MEPLTSSSDLTSVRPESGNRVFKCERLLGTRKREKRGRSFLEKKRDVLLMSETEWREVVEMNFGYVRCYEFGGVDEKNERKICMCNFT